MQKKKYILEDDDFSRMLEITANPKPVAQMVDGRLQWRTHQQRADAFWKSISNKYRFYPDTLECNINPEDPREFVAESTMTTSDAFCTLCDRITGPDHDSGCERSDENGCAWHTELRTSGMTEREEECYVGALTDFASYLFNNTLVLSAANGTLSQPVSHLNKLLHQNKLSGRIIFLEQEMEYIYEK